jgi:amidase
MKNLQPIDELYNHDAMALAELIRKGEMTAGELLEVVINRIEKLNPKLNAIEQINIELAREKARQGLPKGPFEGVPSFIKANLDFPGFSTTYCCKGFADAPPVTWTSPLAQRYIEAGMNIIGKTTLPEFALNTHTESKLSGLTRNPWNPALTTGGSSGGAAALVASGIVPMAHGTDGGGSCRIPSSHCHTVSLKTSRGRHVDVGRVPPIVETQTSQMLTRSVRDLAMSFMVTERRGDNASLPELGFISGPSSKRLKIAVGLKTADGQSADADVLDVIMQTAERCKLMGHEVVELDCLPYHVEDFLDQFMALISVLTGRFAGQFKETFGRPVADGDFEKMQMYFLDAMPDDPEAEWNRLMETAGKISDSFDRLFESYDLILTPTVPVVAKDAAERSIDKDPISQLAGGRCDTRFMAVANTTGHPAITVPAGFNPDGLPVGAQFIAAKGAEDTLFSIAYELEDELKWSRHWAPISVAFAGS